MQYPRILLTIPGLIAACTLVAGEIHDAVKSGNGNAFTAALKQDPQQVNARTPEGLTPLHIAAASNYVTFVSLLVKAGADVDALTPDGKTALHVALESGSADAAVWLIENTLTVYTRGLPTDRTNATAAYELLMTRFRDRPDSERLNFALGILSTTLGEAGRAELAFERALQANPNNDRARFELAVTAKSAGRLSVARSEFEQVLAHKPEPLVEQRLRAYLDEINRQMSPWRFAGRLDAGWVRDGNANVGPKSDTIQIAPIPFGAETITSLTLDRGSQPVAAQGAYASASGSGIYDIGASDGWLLVGDVAYYRNWLDDNWLYESEFYQGDAGFRYVDSHSMAQATLKAARINSGRDPLVDIYGISPVYLRSSASSPTVTWLTAGQAEKRDYAELTARSGTFASLGETLRYGLGKDGRNALSAGVALSHDFTREDIYEYTGVSGTLGFEAWPVNPLKFYGQARFMDSEYVGREALSPTDRTDQQWQFSLGVTATIRRNWGFDLRNEYTDNHSTFDLYKYNRNVTTIGTWVAY